MNPWNLSASDLLVWGIVLHLIADWPLQNDWMANNKAKRAHIGAIVEGTLSYRLRWLVRHPAAYVHAGIHGVFLALIFGWVALPLALVHLIIDTRIPIVWWSKKVIKQTQPSGQYIDVGVPGVHKELQVVYDLGTEVRFWTDQVFHIACVAIAALLVTL